jgi:hypothetical protein
MKMILKVTDEEVKEMVVLAIHSSIPMELGYLHYNPSLRVDKNQISFDGDLATVDYYQGRIVKFTGRKVGINVWDFVEQISDDYQSWKVNYSSYKDLLNAVRSMRKEGEDNENKNTDE